MGLDVGAPGERGDVVPEEEVVEKSRWLRSLPNDCFAGMPKICCAPWFQAHTAPLRSHAMMASEEDENSEWIHESSEVWSG